MDLFTKAFYEALFWSSLDDYGEPLNDNFDIGDLSPDSKTALDDECQRFQTVNAFLMEGLDAKQCGHDFALTRNLHGTGFWDRGLGKIGDELSMSAVSYGCVNLYEGDDGKLHL